MKDQVITISDGSALQSCNVCHQDTIDQKWCNACIDKPEISKYTMNPVQTHVYNKLKLNPELSFVVASKTGTGKSICAWMAIRKYYESGKSDKIVILQPLKQLVREKITELEELFPGKKILELTGDTSDDVGFGKQRNVAIKNSDIVVTSYEMFDSLTRKPDLYSEADSFSMIIIDEIHSIGDFSRGGKLDGAVTRFLLRQQRLQKKPQIVALSATFDNINDLKEYFQQYVDNFEVITSEFTPIKVNIDPPIYVYHKDVNDLYLKLLEKYINNDGGIMCMMLSIPGCKKLAGEINQTYGEGTAFTHFSEMSKDEKNDTVDKFNAGEFKVLCCTPTLLAGVNVAATTIILNCSFFNPMTMEMAVLPTTAIKQATGRVGRPPRYKEGWVSYIAQAGMQHQVRDMLDAPNTIEGALNHQLPLVLNIEVSLQSQSKELLRNWYEHSFSGYSLKGQSDELFNNTIEFLEKYGYIQLRNDVYISTKKGNSVAKNFVSPVFFENCEVVLAEYPINSTETMMTMMESLFSSNSSPIPWTEGKKKHIKSLFEFNWMMDKKTGKYDWNSPEPQVQWTQPTLFTMNGVLNVAKELGLVELSNNAKIINYSMKHLVIPYPLVELGLTLDEHGISNHGSRWLLYLKLNNVSVKDGFVFGPNEFKSPSIAEYNLYMDEFLGVRYNDYRLRYKFAAEGLKKLYKGEVVNG